MADETNQEQQPDPGQPAKGDPPAMDPQVSQPSSQRTPEDVAPEGVASRPGEQPPQTDSIELQGSKPTAAGGALQAEPSAAAPANVSGVLPEDQPDESELPELTLGGHEDGQEIQEIEGLAATPVIRGKVTDQGVALGTGRRKTSVARVRIKKGDGKVTVNGRELHEFVRIEQNRELILAPLRSANQEGQVDVWVRVRGGGTTGQAGAIVLGIARALQAMDPELHHSLADGGYLTRDGRMVERKKYGFKKARRSFQFSKR